MSYKKATHILPQELLEQVQQYVDGEFIYIPRSAENKKNWGSATSTRKELKVRNAQIYAEYLEGETTSVLAERYFLSAKSIQRIVGQMKKEQENESIDINGKPQKTE